MSISNGNVIEIQDNIGSTKAYSGTATTTVANIPASADKIISQIVITTDANTLQVSMDGGSTYFDLKKNDTLSWDVKGNITQIQVKTPSGSVDYKAVINFEDV